MHLFNSLSKLILPLAVLAVPYPIESQPSDEDITQSRNFTIRSHAVDSAQPTFDNLYLEPYHIYPAFNYATLLPKTESNPGIVGFLNGTRRELRDDQANLLFRGGHGFMIDMVNATYSPVEINAGIGTKGMYIHQGFVKYNNPISGGFYACNKTLLYGDAVQLLWRPKPIRAPQGCADVQLVAEYI